ncbi:MULTISPECIES: hypothetical protein [unclassified Acinetobacter]|uniref:hypothetical protein n=1 Tax=unclassified Acinetobacter TaxID=196816 RepID=UPI0007D0517C|nr:hypothetical protein [Acinetobacter sp. SFA]OAL76120.1 hypothetical protein AY607_11055 [Acinetobacter sp. SFA]
MKKIWAFSLVAISLVGCNLNDESESIEFQTPRDQYGVRYNIGDLGGKPVHLGREAPWVEYEDNVGVNTKKKYKRKVRTYESKIQAFGFEMRYTDGLVLVIYHKAPPYSEKQYKAEINLPDNQWIRATVYADQSYNGDLTTRLRNNTLKNKDIQRKDLEQFNYKYIYLPTRDYVYALQKYVPHPQWIEENKRLIMNIGRSTSLYDIKDLYVEKDETGKVMTLIKCSHSEYPKARRCEQEFVLEPEMKARISVVFHSVHLKDWQFIQQQVQKVVLDFIVESKVQKNK